jgi:sirohydrochlorin cobaltochelatase
MAECTTHPAKTAVRSPCHPTHPTILPNTMPTSACLLVSHGSRDPRPSIAATHLAAQITEIAPHLRVKPAVLECSPAPLHQQIQDFAQVVLAQNCTHLYLLPLFLLPGVHVMEDIPEQVTIAQSHLGNAIQITTLPYLGTDPNLSKLLEIASAPSRILLSHGSRRAGGNAPVEAIATRIGATPAYWSVEPNLQTQVTSLVEQGNTDLTILPYFLFEGGITDAIAQTVAQLSETFPSVRLNMTGTLAANSDLAQHIVNLIP